MMRISSRGVLLIVTLAFANETGIGAVHAGTSFDGAWSVVITTDRGTCDPANRLSIDIRDGILQYIGDSAVLERIPLGSNRGGFTAAWQCASLYASD
jgi:hypothetical protein